MKRLMLYSLWIGWSIQLLNGDAIMAFETGDRDPTAPSPRILDRLNATQRASTPSPISETRPRETVQAAVKIPEIRIKAMVFSDADNASVILSANGRSVRMNLSRPQIGNRANTTSRTSTGITIDGLYFMIEDFSDNSIVLRLPADNSLVIVQ